MAIKVLLPSLDSSIDTNWNKTLFTDSATETAVLVSRGQVREGVAQVVKLALGKQLRRHVVLEPEDLGHFHFDTHLPTDIFEQLVACAVDLLSLFDRAMVQPEDDVAVVTIIGKVLASHRYWFISFVVEYRKRTSSIKADTLDGIRVHV